MSAKWTKRIGAVLFLSCLTLGFVAPLFVAETAQAQEKISKAEEFEKQKDLPAGSDNVYSMKKYIGLAMGLAIGLAAFGGSIGQARAAGAALEGIARNPGASNKIFVPMILALAFIESLVLYALVIAFMLNGNL